MGACFIVAVKIVSSQDGGQGASWAAEEAEHVARGGRRIWSRSSPVSARFGIYSCWKIHSCHDVLCSVTFSVFPYD